MDFLYAFILGLVEGLTEFLPISSTGHMILSAKILDIKINDFWRSFLVVIQLGSIMAVVFVFWKKLIQGFNIWFKLAVAFFPTGVMGFFLAKYLKYLFNGYVVAIMLIIGGIIFILIERFYKNKEFKIHSLEELSYKKAFIIGFIQSFAMIPGTSRSGASIIGGLLLGLDRKTAAEFSFLLAIPTMIIASAYSVYKEPSLINNADFFGVLALGFIVAFVVAIFVIKFFLKFIAKFDFIPFGIYRIILGILFLYLFYNGILDANSDYDI